ncbi:putative cytoplasmic protein, partial [Salmonella enterica subsp. enterica serovar Heidelberg str. 77-1831]
MSKKSAKKRQPVVKPAVQEAMSAAVPLGYEEMLTE